MSTEKSPWILWTFAIVACTSGVYLHQQALRKKLEAKWMREREAERTGRIRAEVKLRAASKKVKKEGDMMLTRIGTIVSPFTKRMGTPRQGALVPASRAYVHLNVPTETLDGIDQYSHAWIIFEFHANTDLAESNKTKIRPPRGGGIKVGQLSTRSPHRPNALGLSLVKVDHLDRIKHRFYISAIDLVNGTPVYDIKPCVPWDVPGHFDGTRIRVPKWVDLNDTLSGVLFSREAEHDLEVAVANNLMAPLYTIENGGCVGARETLEQVLAQDPRASHKRGKSTPTSEASYKVVFCQSQIEFRVVDNRVEITSIGCAQFDAASFVDGIPLAKRLNSESTKILEK